MESKLKMNFTTGLFVLIASIAVMYYGRTFLVPLAFGGFLAMVFYPMNQWLMEKGVPKWGQITLSILILLVIGGGLFLTTYFQIRSLVKDWPEISEQMQERQEKAEDYIIQNIGIASEERIQEWKEQISQQRGQLQSVIQSFFGSFFATMTGLLLTVVYMVVFLIEEKRITRFVLKLASDEEDAKSALQASRKVTVQYLRGRLILIGILSVLYSIGFLSFGLQYAIPVAVLVALLSFIPYLGNIIGAVIALAIALATGGGMTLILGVLGTMGLAQVLESNVLTPWIMGEQVSLNPLTTIAGVVGFGTIWGVAGSILAIPILGVLKVFFLHVEGLEPYGYLLSTEEDGEKDK